MTTCVECGSSKNIDQHHVSYEPEELVPLCRSCHGKVHHDPEHELHPDDRPSNTVIEITTEQKKKLDEMKLAPRESYKSVVDRLLKGDTDTEAMQVVPVEDVIGREVPQEQLNQDVTEQLDRIESGVREATNAAQSADKKLEGLGR